MPVKAKARLYVPAIPVAYTSTRRLMDSPGARGLGVDGANHDPSKWLKRVLIPSVASVRAQVNPNWVLPEFLTVTVLATPLGSQ